MTPILRRPRLRWAGPAHSPAPRSRAHRSWLQSAFSPWFARNRHRVTADPRWLRPGNALEIGCLDSFPVGNPTRRPIRNPNPSLLRIRNASQLTPRLSVTDRRTSAIWTSRFTCSGPATRISFSIDTSPGSAAAASRTARSAAAADATSPVSATPRGRRWARTPAKSGSLPRMVRRGSMSRTTDTTCSSSQSLSSRTATVVRPMARPMT